MHHVVVKKVHVRSSPDEFLVVIHCRVVNYQQSVGTLLELKHTGVKANVKISSGAPLQAHN